MASSPLRARMIVGGLLITASIALGAGSGGWQPRAPGFAPDAPLLPAMDALPAQPAVEADGLGPAEPAAAPLDDAAPLEPELRKDSIEGSPAAQPLLVIEGRASWYSDALAGRRTASGERYDPRALIAAHRELPFGTRLRVTNLANDRVVEVRVVDRGPFVAGRILDLSRSAAEKIGIVRAGLGRVRVEVLEYGS